MPESSERGKQFTRKLKVLQVLDRSHFGRTTCELRDEVIESMGLVSLTTKSIERDIRFLQENGYPIVSQKLSNPDRRKVWKLEKNSFLKVPDVPISVLELLSFAAGREFLFPLAGTPYWEGIEMLWQRFRESLPEEVWHHFERERSRMIVRGGLPKNYAKKEGILSAMNRAIAQHRRAEMWYKSLGQKQANKRVVEAYRIVLFNNGLFVVAIDPGRDEHRFRSYKLDRISKVKVLDERFTPKDDGEADRLFSSSVGIFRSEKPQCFRIRFDAETAPWAVETPFHQGQTATRRRDGGVTVEISSAYEDEIIPRVLGLGTHAEILQPKSTRDKLKQTARELSRIYS